MSALFAFILVAGAAAPPCGALVAGAAATCLKWEMKVSEYRKLVRRAHAGDIEATLTLAQFDDERLYDGGRGRKWWLLAAERGDCQALRHMRDFESGGRSAAAAKWRTRIRWNRCAPSVKHERWFRRAL